MLIVSPRMMCSARSMGLRGKKKIGSVELGVGVGVRVRGRGRSTGKG